MHIGFVSENDILKTSVQQHQVIDIIIERGPQIVGLYPRDIVNELYSRELIFLSVPIEDDDIILVPPLEGFVMNRVTGDPFEYAVVYVCEFIHTQPETYSTKYLYPLMNKRL